MATENTYPIKWMQDKDGDRYFPITHLDAVRDENNANLETLLGGKQDELVSTINIKTINGVSILGSGNLSIQTSGGGEMNTIDTVKVNGTALVPDSNKAVDVTVPTESTVSGWGFTKNTGTYSKPSGGIPATDLASAVQTSLGKADTALQSFTETDPTVPSWAKASSKPSYTASEVGAVPTTRKVNGKVLSADITLSASDVGALPSSTVIPDAQIQSDWNQTTTTAKDYIKNKPTIPSAVTESTVSGWGFTKNSGTITGITMNGASKGTSGVVNLGTVITAHQDISGKADKSATVSSVDYNTTSKKITKTINGTTSDVVTAAKIVTDGGGITSHQDISGKADKATTLAGYGITDAKIANGIITLGSNTITPLTSFTESDPVFSASAAAGITSSDITNWNSKTSNTGTITGVSVNGTSVATSGVANITSVPASILSGAIPSAVTATTQSSGDKSTKIATTAYVDNAIENLPEPMIFKGSLGTGGSITSLPTAAAANTGFTYKVITAGTYASQAAKVGDTFISDGSKWNLIPSGDEPSGTVTSIAISATSPIAIDSTAAITTSGTRTISHATSGVTAGTYRSVTVNATGHVTGGTNPTTLSGYGITDAKIANGVITLGSNSITPLTSFTESDPVFTASAASGITSSDISNWNSKTSNVGTITGINMNGTSKGTSGVVDLGTVITAHQDISGKANISDFSIVESSGEVALSLPNNISLNLITDHQDISGKADKTATVSTVAYDTTNHKITKTINGTTTDVVTAATIVSDSGLGLPSVTTSDNGSIMMVTNGAWTKHDLGVQVYYTGTSEPTNAMGNNGDIYVQQSE